MLCPLIINASRLVVELTDPNLEDGLIEQFSRLASVGLPRNSSFTKFRENSFSFCEAKYLIFFRKIGGYTQKIHISQKNSRKICSCPLWLAYLVLMATPPPPSVFMAQGYLFIEGPFSLNNLSQLFTCRLYEHQCCGAGSRLFLL